MAGVLLAPGRLVLGIAERRGEPDPAFAVDRRVVIVDVGIPHLLLAPVGGRPERPLGGGVAWSEHLMHVRVADRCMKQRGGVLHRIKHRDVVPAVFGLAGQWAMTVYGGVVLVCGDQVVAVMLLVRP